jgi:hypothetical protein
MSLLRTIKSQIIQRPKLGKTQCQVITLGTTTKIAKQQILQVFQNTSRAKTSHRKQLNKTKLEKDALQQ